jgi:phosphatidylinositol glycan class V
LIFLILCYSSLTALGLVGFGIPHYNNLEVVVAVLVAHLSHLLSTTMLFKLTATVFPTRNVRFAFVAAALHIVSPAGLFLSAPYAESSCAMLSFAGSLLFVKSLTAKKQKTLRGGILVLLAGIVFGVATTFRSNGILNGLLLLEEAIRILWCLQYSFDFASFRRLVFTGIGGLCVGSGFFLPQYIAYNEYCWEMDVSTLRPWCGKTVPSIYTFVQEHYWYACR